MEEKRFGPVHFIPGHNKGNYPHCHSVYIEGAGILIDPSSDRKRLIQLKDEAEINEVWLSHYHEDHIMHLDLFDDLPLKMSEKDAGKLSDIEHFMDFQWFGVDNEDHRNQWRTMLKEQFHFKIRTPAGYLKHGDIVKQNGISIKVLHTPGHTPGSLSFFFMEPRVLFMGDYDLGKIGPMYGDRLSSIHDFISSVNLLREIPARVWITAHEQGIYETDPTEKWDRYLSVISQREEKLLAFLSEPRSIDEIAKKWIVYGGPKEPVSFYEIGERVIMKKHLEILLEKSIIASDGKRFRKL